MGNLIDGFASNAMRIAADAISAATSRGHTEQGTVSSNGDGSWSVDVGGQTRRIDAAQPFLPLDINTSLTLNADGSLTLEENGRTTTFQPPAADAATDPNVTASAQPQGEPMPIEYAIAVQIDPKGAGGEEQVTDGTTPIDGFRATPSTTPIDG